MKQFLIIIFTIFSISSSFSREYSDYFVGNGKLKSNGQYCQLTIKIKGNAKYASYFSQSSTLTFGPIKVIKINNHTLKGKDEWKTDDFDHNREREILIIDFSKISEKIVLVFAKRQGKLPNTPIWFNMVNDICIIKTIR